jgi:hypothetical protein
MSTVTPPAGFPSGIQVFQETFENWAQMIEVPNLWTCVPDTEADVVRVCNWAAGAGFTVRARGKMHTWSPLTVTNGQSPANVMLVDMTKSLNKILGVTPAQGNQPASVLVQTGATMDALMAALESAPGGKGPASGFSLPHIPAPGSITVGGVLAINAHGTAVPMKPHDDFPISYGSLSNQILEFTAVVTMPGTKTYVAHTFKRGEGDDRAFLTHCGRALLLNVTLQVIDNYNLRCQSITQYTSVELFAPPVNGVPPANSVGDFFNRTGRVEVIWFPLLPILLIDPHPVGYPWLKVWSVEATKPSSSTKVDQPYNYGFSDNLPPFLTTLLRGIVDGNGAFLTPTLTRGFEKFTNYELQSLSDLWGPSKNTLLYVKDDTLPVTANGYAILMKRDQVQQAIADFTDKFNELLEVYLAKPAWPINSPLEIRVTALDDTSKIVTPSGNKARSPVISSLSVDADVQKNGWDVACWFDVLTLMPKTGDPQHAYGFYADLEDWTYKHFATGFRVCPEWSKGWAYTSQGPWTNTAILQKIRDTFTNGRGPDETWAWEVATLAQYDAANLYSNPFLQTLFG